MVAKVGVFVMMEVEQQTEHLIATEVLAAILQEFSAITDYRTLRDSLPRRLAYLIKCRCVLLYQRIGETLQLASGTFDDKPGWSASLLAVAHINPIDLRSDSLEAQAWRARHAISAPIASTHPAFVAVPLIYRQRAIGVLVAIRGGNKPGTQLLAPQSVRRWTEASWSQDEVQVVEVAASIIAMLLENARLLERDRERIHELSLLNSISSQMNCSMHDQERLHSIVVQRTKEISGADLCEVLLPAAAPPADCWITPALHEMLLHHFGSQRESQPSPLIIERAGDVLSGDYLNQLPGGIKTFFAIPLLNRGGDRSGVSGIVVGAYHRPWKLRREELVLLQVLVNQAGAILENIALMEAVVEARNEARKLLRQVLDDQRLKALILESIPSGLITVDLHGQITTFNHSAQSTLGYHPFEVLGHPLQDILSLTSLEQVIETGRTQGETLVTIDRNDREIALDVALSPLHDDRGKRIGVLATFADVTTMHRLEEEKRRLDRLASLGQMAASVAHEVRNPLASIKTSVQMLIDEFAGDTRGQLVREEGTGGVSDGMQESISVVLKEIERLDAIVRDLLLFSRPRRLHIVECDITELSERMLQVIGPQCLEAGIVVHRVYHAVPMARVDVAQIEQMLMNLYLNALQAMPEGGVLTISCQVVEAAKIGVQAKNSYALEVGLPVRMSDKQQSWLELSISDTGSGIKQDQLERIFQPFFTTKAHGIGLGLPITRRLVEDHHGYMLVESQFGYGATFSVRLPLDCHP